MLESIIDKELLKLDYSYDHLLDDRIGFSYKKKAKERILLILDISVLDSIHRGILYINSNWNEAVKFRIKYLPSEYIKFMRIISKILINVDSERYRLGYGISLGHIVKNIIIYGDLSYGIEYDDMEKLPIIVNKRLSLQEISILQDVLLDFYENYLDYYADKPINLDELKSLELSVNNYIDGIWHKMHKKYSYGFFNKLFINIKSYFRKDIYKFALEYLNVIRSQK